VPAPPLLLRGGRVIDPAQGLDGPNDVLIRDGRIAAVGPALAADGAAVLDVAGALVLPGLIDCHVHCFNGLGNAGIDPDLLGVSRGVTTVVDAGSASCASFPLFRDQVIAPARTRVLAYLNLSTLGMVVGPHFANLGDPRLVDPDGIAGAAQAHPDAVVGIKMLATANTVGPLGFQPLRRGRALADELGLPLLVHVGESWGDAPALPIEQVVELLRPGDTLTHLFTSQRGGLLDASGRLHPAVREARQRGVRFDVGHGINNLSFAVARCLLDQGFAPDTVSTDGSLWNVGGPVYDLPTTMSKLLALGLPLPDVVAMATSASAALLGRSAELGSLAVGRVADVSVLRLAEREWTAVDSVGERLTAPRELVPLLTVRAGEVIDPRPAGAP